MKLLKVGTQDGSLQPQAEWVSIAILLYFQSLLLLFHHHPLSLLHSSFAGSQNSMCLTDQALLIHRSAKNLLILPHLLSITAFCIRI